jgi:hypothetical protein
VFRYDLQEAKTAHPDLIDGALFAFVQGTDPEVLLLLEAVRHDKGPRWQFACARATAGGLEAKLDGQVVWSADKSSGNVPPSSPQITIRKPLP